MDALSFGFNYDELGIPRVFTIEDIQYGSGVLTVYAKLIPEKITEMAMDYRDNALNEIENLKNEQPVFVKHLIEQVLKTDVLSEGKIAEYVENILSNGELVNSAFYFATSGELKKYAELFENASEKVVKWAAPLTSLNLSGDIDDLANEVLDNDELKDTLAWFVSRDEIDKYETMAKDYYELYTTAIHLFDSSVDTKGTIDDLADSLFGNKEIKTFLAGYIPSETIDEYEANLKAAYNIYKICEPLMESAYGGLDIDLFSETLLDNKELKDNLSFFVSAGTIDEYEAGIKAVYNIYETVEPLMYEYFDIDLYADTLLENNKLKDSLSIFVSKDIIYDVEDTLSALYGIYSSAQPLSDLSYYENFDIEELAGILLDNSELKASLSYFVSKDVVDEYESYLQTAYDVYNDFYLSLDSLADSIDMELVDFYAELIIDGMNQSEEARILTIDEVERINTGELIGVFEYLENDEGRAGNYLHSVDNYYYDNFRLYLEDAGWMKDKVLDYLNSYTVEDFKDYTYVVDEVKEFIELFNSRDYYKTLETISSSRTLEMLIDVSVN